MGTMSASEDRRIEKQKLKQFAGHSIIYGLGEVLYKGVVFLLLPVYLKYLSPAEFGVLEAITVTRDIGFAFLAIGIPSAFLKYYFEKSDLHYQKTVISTAFWLYILILVPIPFVLIVFDTPLSNLILKTDRYAVCFSILAVNIFLIAFRRIPLTLYRAQNRPLKYTSITFVVGCLTLLSNIYFVVFLNKGVEGVLWGNFCGGMFGILLVLPDVREHVSFKIQTELLKKMMSYGIPISISIFLYNTIFMNDRYFLAQFSTLDELGKYALGTKFSKLLLVFFVTPFQLNWVPFILDNKKEANHQEIYAKVGSIFYYMGINLVFFLSLFSPLVISLIAPESYFDVYPVIPILSFAALLSGVEFIFKAGILLSENTAVITKIAAIGLVISLGLNFLLIPHYGMYGASFSMLASFILMACYSYYEGQKKMPIRYPLVKMAAITCATIVLVLFYYLLYKNMESFLIRTLLAFLFSFVFILVSYLSGIFNISYFISLFKKSNITTILKEN